jgi:hypothetical protein
MAALFPATPQSAIEAYTKSEWPIDGITIEAD